jgi:glycosyltransferase involved in cell wall biosynthesis
MNLYLSVVIPCYKGEEFIEESIKTLEKEISLLETDFELIVVIDGFIDRGYYKAKALEQEYTNLRVFGYEKNRGKGYAIQYGLKQSRGRYVAFIDSDLDYHPKALSWFFEIIRDSDVDLVIGNRKDERSTFNYPLFRRIASWGFNAYARILFPELKVDDTQAGFKLIKKNAAEKVLHYLERQKEAEGFIFDICLLVVARKLKIKVVQAPCIFEMKSSTIGIGENFFKSALKMGKEVWRFRKHFHQKAL